MHTVAPTRFTQAAIRTSLEWLLGALFMVLLVAGFTQAAPALLHVPTQYDFAVYYNAARNLNLHQPLYQLNGEHALDALGEIAAGTRPGFLYPPIAAVLFRPLAYLPLHSAEAVWYGLNFILLWTALWMISRMVRVVRGLAFVGLCLLAIMLPPVYETMLFGQINLVILLLVAGAAYWATQAATTRHATLAGMLLGIAAVIKVYPALFALAWLVRRRVVPLVAMAATGLALLVVGIPAGGGWANTRDYFWGVLPLLSTGVRLSPTNQSIRAVVGRLFTTNQFQFGVSTPGRSATITVLPLLDAPWLGTLLGTGLAALVLITTAVVLWRVRANGDSQTTLLTWSLLITTSLLVTPVAWDHHFVLLLLPGAVLWQASRDQRVARLPLLVAAVLLSVQRYWRYLTLWAVSPRLMLWGMAGVLTLWLTTMWCLRINAQASQPTARREASPPPFVPS